MEKSFGFDKPFNQPREQEKNIISSLENRLIKALNQKRKLQKELEEINESSNPDQKRKKEIENEILRLADIIVGMQNQMVA